MHDILDDLDYTHTHQWVAADGEFAVLGATAPILRKIAPVDMVGLPAVDQHIAAGQTVGYIQGRGGRHAIVAAFDGVVTGINPHLITLPALIDRDPYRAGWLFRIQLAARARTVKLLDAKSYRELVTAAGM